MNLNKIVLIISIFCFLTSCKTKKETFNYINENDEKVIQILKENGVNTIQAGDQLVILVSAKDNDVVKPFNQNFNSSEVVMPSFGSTNTTSPNPAVVGPTYVVDENWDVDFPVIGKVNAKDKSITQFKEVLATKLKEHLKNPIVSIRNVNFKISVIGEVLKEGQFLITDSQVNIFGAIALAGGATMYGLKEKVRLIRNVDGNVTRATIDLTSSDFINSPYYYLKQNDVVIIDANKTKIDSRNFGPTTTLYISIASILASILVTIIAIVARN